MQKHGMVLNIDGSSAVVLTRDGEFCKIPSSPGMEIGQEATWAAASEIGPKAPQQRHRRGGRRQRSSRFRTLTAGMAASIALVAGLWYGIGGHVDQAQAYAFVSVDVNPDVSLTVNRDLKVIAATSDNAQGQKIIASLNLKGQSLAVAMQEIIAAAVSDHRLTPHGSIMVASAPAQTGSVNISQVESEATQDVHQVIADNADIAKLAPAVVSVGVSDSLWKASEQVHVSPARLAAFLIARSGGYQGTMNGLSGDVLERFANMNAVAGTSQALQSATPSQVATLLSQLGGGLSDSASSAGDGSGDSGQSSDGGGQTQSGGTGQGDASGHGSEPMDKSHGDMSGQHDGHSDKNSHDGNRQSSDNRGQQDGMGTQTDGQSRSGDGGASGSSDGTSNTASGDGQNQMSASLSNQDSSSSGTSAGSSDMQSSGSDTTFGSGGSTGNSISGSGGDSWTVNASGGGDSSNSSNNGD